MTTDKELPEKMFQLSQTYDYKPMSILKGSEFLKNCFLQYKSLVFRPLQVKPGQRSFNQYF